MGYWYKNGVRVDANPTLFESFNRDRAICDGEAAKVALTSTEKKLAVHNLNVNLVFDACLTERGYIRRQETHN